MAGKKKSAKDYHSKKLEMEKKNFSSNFEDLRFSDIVGWFARIF
jgi:hypothetical protein